MSNYSLKFPIIKVNRMEEMKIVENSPECAIKLCFVSSEQTKSSTDSEKQHKPQDSPARRTMRNTKKPIKYDEFMDYSPTKRRVQRLQRMVETSEEDDSFDEEISPSKPTALFSYEDVEGQDIFKFKSRHTKLDLQNKVKTAINSPKVDSPMRTPRKILHAFASSLGQINEATPKHVKDIIKKRIVREIESDSADSDFSASSSDFVPEESGNEAETTASSSEAEDETKTDVQTNKVQISKTRDNKMNSKNSEYVVTPDDYFMMNSSKRIKTSDHTLARLKNINLLEDEQNALENTISLEHKNKIKNLNKSYEQLFNRWLYVLSENFNVVLYGIGSKRSILHRFRTEKLQDFPTIIVNGFFPSLTVKNILEGIVIDLLENTHVPSNVGDVINLINTQLSENGVHVFLFVHNIDGTSLRNTKAQSTLASLSQIKNIHVIATIDHINAPLLWDHSKLSKYRFTWWDVTTFQPYSEETSFENSLMTQRSGAFQLSSLRSVYQSLTTNAKEIFNIIIKYQLENHKQTHYQGLAFKDLYSKSRERFLVSSDIALRAQLTEFIDHKLVRMKRTYDGSENLVVPIEDSLLNQFLDKQNGDD